MNKKEIINLGNKLLRTLPNFALKGQLLCVQPIDHILRAIFFDTSIDPRKFYVQVFIQPLFIPASHLCFNVGFRIGGMWDIDAPNMISELVVALKHEALPFLRCKNVAEVIHNLAKNKDPYTQQTMAYLAVYEKNSRATGELDKLISLLDSKIDWQKRMIDQASFLKVNLSEKPDKVRHQLDVWEKETRKNLNF